MTAKVLDCWLCKTFAQRIKIGTSKRMRTEIKYKNIWLKVKNLPFSCSTQQGMKINLLINVIMPTIGNILTFISKIKTPSESFKARQFFIFCILVFMSS